MTAIQWSDGAPIYRQLKERVIAMMLDGVLRPGDALPSVRQVAAEYQLNPITVSRAYQELADEALVEKRRGLGMYVTEEASKKLLASERERFLTEEWPQVMERIQRLGMDTNYWSTGLPGPAGPCSEIFFDRGPQYGIDGGPATDDPRYLEIWNLVFMQYLRGEGRSKDDFDILGELPKKNIDTGMGLERVAFIKQGVENLYEIDQVRPVLDRAAELSGRRYGADHDDDVRMRVIADHLRGHVLADHRPVLEAVAGAAAHDPRVRPRRMPVDDEMRVRGRLVLADAPFGDRLLESPRSFADRTSISGGIDAAVGELARAPFSADRRTIDVSGDGTNNAGRDIGQARDEALALGITINGLAILSETPLPWNPEHTNPAGGLTKYYRDNVIGGPGSFVIEAKDFSSFGQAIIKKMIAEIADARGNPATAAQ